MSEESNGSIGLFPITLEIGTEQPGAPRIIAQLAVNTPARTVSGEVTITQAVNPPVNFHVQVRGDFTYMTVMPDNTRILVVLSQVPTPVLNTPAAELRLVLESDWQSGTANVKYSPDLPGHWTSLSDLPVKIVDPAGVPAAA
jgi:hypothetical protein